MNSTNDKSASAVIVKIREQHIEKINNLIDAIINLEEYYSQMPSELSSALQKANSLRNLAEEEIEVGDRVWDSFTKKVRTVSEDGTVNFIFDDEDKEHSFIGKKFCFKLHY